MLVIANVANRVAENVEFCFNIFDSIPVFGVLGCVGRFTAAKAQIVAGLTFAAFGVVAMGLGKMTDDAEFYEEAREFARFGVAFTGHGIANVGRSVLELMSQVMTLGLATLLFNLSQDDEFQPVIKYETYDDGFTCGHVYA